MTPQELDSYQTNVAVAVMTTMPLIYSSLVEQFRGWRWLVMAAYEYENWQFDELWERLMKESHFVELRRLAIQGRMEVR